jgi:hypothetical protein
MKALFIGGPKAGLNIDVDGFVHSVGIPFLGEKGWGQVVYHRRQIRMAAGSVIDVFCCDQEDPLLTLMNFYAEAKHS